MMNERLTAEKARKYLRVNYQTNCKQLAIPSVDIKSPSLSSLPSGSPAGNPTESQIVDSLDKLEPVAREVYWSKKALQRVHIINPLGHKIITECYLRDTIYRVTQDTLAHSLGLSRRKLQEVSRDACCQFAGAMKEISEGNINLVIEF